MAVPPSPVKTQAIAMLQESLMAQLDALEQYELAAKGADMQREAQALQELRECMKGSHLSMGEFLRRLGERW